MLGACAGLMCEPLLPAANRLLEAPWRPAVTVCMLPHLAANHPHLGHAHAATPYARLAACQGRVCADAEDSGCERVRLRHTIQLCARLRWQLPLHELTIARTRMHCCVTMHAGAWARAGAAVRESGELGGGRTLRNDGSGQGSPFHVCSHMYTKTHTCMHACTHAHTHTHAHMHTHAHTRVRAWAHRTGNLRKCERQHQAHEDLHR